MKRHVKIEPYWGPVGGWGSARAVSEILLREGRSVEGPMTLAEQNKPSGFACVSCSYAKPGQPKFLEFCENGAKATAWEITSKRCGPDFFAAHTLTELEKWSDHSLEEVGRLTEPMRYDQETDKYRPVKWEDAFAQIGKALRGFHPSSIVFYTSGRASLEASYMYQLFARMYGSNNLPDSSNMCHESTSVALPETIGVPVGTVKLEDFPPGNRSRCSRLCAFKCSHSVLRHGLDTAQIRCARDSDAKQFPPNAGQYWQAGRRHFSCARPLECAGPAYRRNHREA